MTTIAKNLRSLSAWLLLAPVGARAAESTGSPVPEPVPPVSAVAAAPGTPTAERAVDGALALVAPGLKAAPVHVMVGRSALLRTAGRIRRVSVTDPAVADAMVVTPNQVLIQGRSAGDVSLLVWDEAERSQAAEIVVDMDVAPVAREMKQLFPEQPIEVSASRDAIVLSGRVGDKEAAARAVALAGAYAKNVVNALAIGPAEGQAVLLEVKFAEVDRTALMQIGANLFSTGAGNTFGAASTQQFGGFTGSNSGHLPAGVQGGSVQGNNIFTSGIGSALSGQPGSFATNDLLNLFLFRTDLNLGVLVKALEQKNVLQILAEPNLIAVNGKEASFLAGGEFPYPVVQPSQGFNAVTIQFREFGVRLRFTPNIMPNGNIHLQVQPEVSALDFSNALTISGFTVPALSTRKADTEFELSDGQSFAIAGLMDNRLTNLTSKIPGLGDIPILGTFFKSKSVQSSKTELMVLVTAHRVSPGMKAPAVPSGPLPYLDTKGFDKAVSQGYWK